MPAPADETPLHLLDSRAAWRRFLIFLLAVAIIVGACMACTLLGAMVFAAE